MSDMQKQFNEAFEKIDTVFQSKNLSRVKVTFKGAANNISNLIDILLRKSLLKQDAYNYDDDHTSSFFLPEEKNFNETEKNMVIYERLKALIVALEYQSGNMPESLEYFSDEYLEDSRKLISYFAFNNYISANNINTRSLKELTDKITTGNDEIFKRVVQDNLKLLSENFQSIQLFLEEVTKYKKENYKSQIRFDIFPTLPPREFNEKLLQDNPDIYMKKLEEFMKINNPETPFNRMWIPESIRECYNINDSEALEKILSAFLSDTDKQKLETNANSPRERLIKLINNLATARSPLNDIYINFDYNLKLIQNREKNFIEKLKEVLMKLFNITNQEEFFHIEYVNPQTKNIQKDIINIHEFLSAVKKKITLFSEITKPVSTVAGKIKRGTEDALYKFLEESYINLMLMKERFLGVDAELRLSTPKQIRNKLRDIKIPLDELNTILVKVGEQRRKLIIQQEHFSEGKK